jgi:Glycosyl transferase family 2
VSEPAILVAARDEEAGIGRTIARLRSQFPGSRIVVADDGSRDLTGEAARAAGGEVVRIARLGKGEALNAAEGVAPPGPLLLCDADLDGDLAPLVETPCDLAIAAFATRVGGGLGLAKGTARRLILARTGFDAREPLSGQRYLTERARAVCFPLARGFGCELRMTIDALEAGLAVEEVELPLSHRPTGRTAGGFAHRGRQLVDAIVAAGPLAANHRGNRLPVLGLLVALGGIGSTRRVALGVLGIAVIGAADDLWSGPERGFPGHMRAGGTTGILKLVAIPTIGLAATRSLSGGLLVGLAANALNQLDTKPGRALKAYLLAVTLLGRRIGGRYTTLAVLLLPYDLRERGMLGDAGSNALGAVLGLGLVARLTARERRKAVGILAGLNLLGELTSV